MGGRDFIVELKENNTLLYLSAEKSKAEEALKNGKDYQISIRQTVIINTRSSRTYSQLPYSTLREKSVWFLVSLSGIAAAAVLIPEKMEEVSETQLCVAFDGDAVLFSNESELVFEKGLEAFLKHEKDKVGIPMNEVQIRTNTISLNLSAI